MAFSVCVQRAAGQHVGLVGDAQRGLKLGRPRWRAARAPENCGSHPRVAPHLNSVSSSSSGGRSSRRSVACGGAGGGPCVAARSAASSSSSASLDSRCAPLPLSPPSSDELGTRKETCRGGGASGRADRSSACAAGRKGGRHAQRTAAQPWAAAGSSLPAGAACRARPPGWPCAARPRVPAQSREGGQAG